MVLLRPPYAMEVIIHTTDDRTVVISEEVHLTHMGSALCRSLCLGDYDSFYNHVQLLIVRKKDNKKHRRGFRLFAIDRVTPDKFNLDLYLNTTHRKMYKDNVLLAAILIIRGNKLLAHYDLNIEKPGTEKPKTKSESIDI